MFCLVGCSNFLFANNPCYLVCQSNENAIFEYTICPPQDGNSRPDYVAGKLFLKISPKYAHGDFKYDAKQPKAHRGIVYFKDLIDEYGIYLIEKPFKTKAMQRHYQVHFSQIQKTDQLLEALRKLPFTEYAEKVAARYTYYTPNDPDLPKQYNLKNIEAENAWDVTKGSDKITIAIVDDAVKITHNDLKDNIWVNSNEIPNDNLDNDSNGFVDDVNGWDPADNDNDPNPPNTANDNEFSHGTHCAGISSATTDNALGIASIGFKTKIIAVKCTKDGPYTGSIDAGYQGVDYAMAAGARIISMSWGGGAPSATEQDLFDAAHAAGIVLICAAGNDNTDNPMYPASYDYAISVAASDEDDKKADFSNYGATIDVTAPGVDIWSTVATTNDSYFSYSGTSMACPLVSGVAALILAYDPGMPPDKVEECIKTTADPIEALNPGFEGKLGAGRVNAYKAVLCAKAAPTAIIESSFIDVTCVFALADFYNKSFGANITSVEWTFDGGTPATSTEQDPKVYWSADGTYMVTLKVTNPEGSDIDTMYVNIGTPSGKFVCNDTTLFPGYPTFLKLEFTGTPPWKIIINDGTKDITVSGIDETPYFWEVFPDTSTTYTMTKFFDANCIGDAGGDCTVYVDTETECLDCPAYLVQEVLLGGGCISAFNVKFTGDPSQLSYFEKQTDLDIGFSSGLMLTTGDSDFVYGPNDSGSETQAPGGNSLDGDPDLDELNPSYQTNDAAVLEFDFIPSEPNVSFKYVFGSEEYNEFVNSSYNDVFGFFLSGPGISGPYSNSSVNIALIPGTSTPVSINNVNNGLNSSYYEDNTGGMSSIIETQLDGCTVTLTAEFTGLEKCELYHIKLGVADAGDHVLDSAVFLEANSFTDGSDVDVVSFGAVPGTKTVYEGCKNGYFFFERGDGIDINTDMTLLFKTAGSAIPGVDYEPLPASITIPAGDTAIVLFVTVYEDNITEGLETVSIKLDEVECGCTTIPILATLVVYDNLAIDAVPAQTICPGGSAQLDATGAVSYEWSPPDGLSCTNCPNPVASPSKTTMYKVVGTDTLGCKATDSVMVYLANVPYIPNISIDTSLCIDGEAKIKLNNLSPISNYQYLWSPATGLDNPKSLGATATITGDITYTLTITNQQGCTGTQTVTINVDPVVLEFDLKDVSICPDEQAILDASGNYSTWLWSNGETTPTISVSQSGEYSVTVTDKISGCDVSDFANVTIYAPPTPTLGGDTLFFSGNTATIFVNETYATYTWDDDKGQTTQSITVTKPGTYTVTVTDANGCEAKNSITVAEIPLETFLFPNAFSPNNDGLNDYFNIKAQAGIKTASMRIYDRWGNLVFSTDNLIGSNGWDGNRNSSPVSAGVYVFAGTAQLNNGDLQTFKGNITLLRQIRNKQITQPCIN